MKRVVSMQFLLLLFQMYVLFTESLADILKHYPSLRNEFPIPPCIRGLMTRGLLMPLTGSNCMLLIKLDMKPTQYLKHDQIFILTYF